MLHVRAVAAASAVTRCTRILHKFRDWLAYKQEDASPKIAPIYIYSCEKLGTAVHVHWTDQERVPRTRENRTMTRKGTPYRVRQFLSALVSAGLLHVATLAHADPADDNQDEYINADRPGIADGSNVVGKGRFQIETGVQREYQGNSSSGDVTTFIPALLRLGISQNLEARLESNTYTWMKLADSNQGARLTKGFAPASLGLKYHFIDSEGAERPSLGAIVRVFPPAGSGRFRTTQTTGDFRLAADWDFAPKWSLNPNIGVAFYQEDADTPRYMAGLFAATVNYNPSKTLNVFLDMGIKSPESNRGKTSVIFDIGLAYIIGKNTQLDVSIGAGAVGETSPLPFISAGISHRF